MQQSLTAFAWKHSKKDQLLLLFLTMITFPLIWISLELPKAIINDAIEGSGFPREFWGFEFDQIPYLFALCGLYLLVISLNNGLKFHLNYSRGIAGERMLRRMRFDLFSKVMARPLPRMRQTSSGELVQMISAELAPIGDFIGALVSTPVSQGGSFLVFLSFIMVQNPLIGAAALVLYPLQAWLIPKLQARVVAAIRERLTNIRAMAREINESVEGAAEIRALRVRRWHMAVVSRQLYDNFKIRRRIFILKFLIKFVNNVANHLTPFFIFMIGGYFVIEGTLDVGALTAVLIAYKDLANPWKELLRYYQDFSDMSARFSSVMENFVEDDDPRALPFEAPVGTHALELEGARVDGLPRSVACHAPRAGVTAVIAEDQTTRTALIQALSGIGLGEGQAGAWKAGTATLYRASVMVAADARAYTGTFRDNMLHGLQFRPVSPPDDAEAEARRKEAELTGAPTDDTLGDWIAPKEAGYADRAAVENRMLQLAERLGIEEDLYMIGLASRVDPQARPDLAAQVLELRRVIAASDELGPMREDFVDNWARDRYVADGSVGENLFYARPADPTLHWADFIADRAVFRAIDEAGMRRSLVEIGVDLSDTLLQLFEGVAGDSDIVKRYGLFPKSETPQIEAIVRRAKARGPDRLRRAEQSRMMALAMDYVSARFRLSIMRGRDRVDDLLKARERLRPLVERDDRFVQFDEDAYVAPFTILENLLFGPVKTERRDSWGVFKSRVDVLVRETGLRDDVVRAGLDRPVGEEGHSLNARQRRRLALGRALMKNPGALLLDGVASSAEPHDVELRDLLRAELAAQPDDDVGPGALIYAADGLAAAAGADHVIRVERSGAVVEGPPESFDPPNAGEDGQVDDPQAR